MTDIRCKYCGKLLLKANEKRVNVEFDDIGDLREKCDKCKNLNLFKIETLEVQDE